MYNILLLCYITTCTYCANILVWNPTIGYSHVRFLGSIADILHQDGHNVTIISPIVDPRVDMIGHKYAISQIPYESKYMDQAEDYSKMGIKTSSFWESPVEQGFSLSRSDFEGFVKNTQNMYRGLAEDKVFLARLRDCNFDIAVHEIYDPYQVGVFELIGVKKTVAVSAIGITPYVREVTGVSTNPSYIPGSYTTYGDEMSFWERLDNFKLEIELSYRSYIWERKVWSYFNAVYPGFPDFKELLKQKVGVVLLNVNEFIESPRPTANIVRYIAGISIPEPKPLDKELSALLDKRSSNVLFSFGTFTQAKNMPLWLKKDIVEAFASFPNTTFIWKYEDESETEVFGAHPNIHRMKWLPQKDLLADKRLSLFITHAGMNSIIEATFAGKPMVAIPLFGDQFLNAKNLRRRGLAIMIERNKLTRDTLVAAIREALSPESSYAHKAAVVAQQLHGRAAAAREELSRWVNLVAEEGQMDHLLLRARDLSFIQYHCLDIIAFLLAQFVMALCLIIFTAKIFLGRIARLFTKRKIE